MSRPAVLSVLLCLAVSTRAFAQDPAPPAPSPAPAQAASPAFKISGLVFGDVYYLQSPFEAFDEQHGVWLRRAYFTYDHTFSPAITARFRLEVNSNGRMAGGTLTPYVKDAYLRWTFWRRQAVTLGIHPSLTFEFVDAFWGLRHIEKTPLDLYRIDPSRETGVTLGGPLNDSQSLKYQVQYGTGSGNSAETDRFKTYRAAARYETNPGINVEGVFGHANRNNDADWTLAQIVAGYRQPRWRAAFLYGYQKRRAGNGVAPESTVDIFSGFGVFDIKPQRLIAFARVDRFNDPCADCAAIEYLPIDGRQPFTLTIAGVDYFIHPAVRFSPNIEYVVYGNPPDGSAKPARPTAAARLTFYWVW